MDHVLYAKYFKLYTCYKWRYKRMKRLRLVLKLVSAGLVSIGVVAGAVTLNPIILGCISGPGIILQEYYSQSKINKNVEMCRFAFVTYKKVLGDISNAGPGDMVVLLSDLKVIDEIVTDLCPTINGMSDKYERSMLPLNEARMKEMYDESIWKYSRVHQPTQSLGKS